MDSAEEYMHSFSLTIVGILGHAIWANTTHDLFELVQGNDLIWIQNFDLPIALT